MVNGTNREQGRPIDQNIMFTSIQQQLRVPSGIGKADGGRIFLCLMTAENDSDGHRLYVNDDDLVYFSLKMPTWDLSLKGLTKARS